MAALLGAQTSTCLGGASAPERLSWMWRSVWSARAKVDAPGGSVEPPTTARALTGVRSHGACHVQARQLATAAGSHGGGQAKEPRGTAKAQQAKVQLGVGWGRGHV